MQHHLSKFNKIIIVGDSCSGKTTLCRKLGRQLNYPFFDLDNFHWLPNWVERQDEEMITKIQREILVNQQWIVSGNYSSIMEKVTWVGADAIIWLKYSKWLCLWRCFKRSLRRSLTKEACCNGNYESLSNSFLKWDKENLFVWIYTQHEPRKAKYESWRMDQFSDKKWFVFERPQELESFMIVLK